MTVSGPKLCIPPDKPCRSRGTLRCVSANRQSTQSDLCVEHSLWEIIRICRFGIWEFCLRTNEWEGKSGSVEIRCRVCERSVVNCSQYGKARGFQERRTEHVEEFIRKKSIITTWHFSAE